MHSTQVHSAIQKQRTFFNTGKTKEISFRKQMLQKLKDVVVASEASILESLKQDMNKPAFEAFAGEIAFFYDELKFAKKHLHQWVKPKRVPTPLIHAIGSSHILSEPLGIVLIIGPWNYPFQLLMAPLIGAIAAGNCAVLKPSELAPHTSKAVAEMIAKHFDPQFITTIEGGVEVSQALLAEQFDHIFFTGGTVVGKVVMAAAAKFLTPVTLELGGKSPCLVDRGVPIETTARRIVWGKFFNAGQTCVAPDYVLVPKELKQSLLDSMKKSVEDFFGKDPSQSPDYARIINKRHFERLKSYLDPAKTFFGGQTKEEELYLSPTILNPVSTKDKVMEDEIFGPILPVLEYTDLGEAISQINSYPKPLALYVFSDDRAHQDRVLSEVSFGGGCINDTIIHLSNPHMPFGGVGPSGMGAYHGQYSFDTFSHKKSIVRKSFLLDIKLRYPPYRNRLQLLKRFFGA